ncbi:MAG: glycosyltransferase [Patescibacteria group bacterium]
MNYNPLVSVIIPVEEVGPDLEQAVEYLLKQSYQNFEILVFVTRDTGKRFAKTTIIEEKSFAGRPAEKRDLALKYAKGDIFAFIDDDVYPSVSWLSSAVKNFEDLEVAGVGGPMLTPIEDSLMEKAGGWVWASKLGSGGAGTYRCLPEPKRLVDDYPTANLLVRRSDFTAVGGFDSKYWPGEDTKLCLDLTKKLGKKIIYDPGALVYHHRRALFYLHLRQIRGYGQHRGYFARVLPETSRRLGYFLPSLFFLGTLLCPVILGLFLISQSPLSTLAMGIYGSLYSLYFFLLLATGVWVWRKSRDWRLGLLVMPGIVVTHLYYGFMFLRGFFSQGLKRNTHPFFLQKNS